MTPSRKKSVLVTGATGFVGGALVQSLLKEGCSVTCLVRSTSNTHDLRNAPVRMMAGNLEQVDVSEEPLQGFDIVYHVAGAIKAATREDYFRANQGGTRNLVQALSKQSPGLSRFIYVSSLAAAGPSPAGQALTEDAKPNPISWYGESKLHAEYEVLKFAKAFPVTILRPSAVYGPRDSETLLIFRMIQKGCLIAPGRFTRRFSLIHVDDLVAALIRAAEVNTPSGEAYYISRPESCTWDEVGQAIANSLNTRYRRIPLPKRLAQTAGLMGDLWSKVTGRPATINTQKVRELLQPSWVCDPSRALKCLGFAPAVTLERGIPATTAWYQAQGWL